MKNKHPFLVVALLGCALFMTSCITGMIEKEAKEKKEREIMERPYEGLLTVYKNGNEYKFENITCLIDKRSVFIDIPEDAEAGTSADLKIGPLNVDGYLCEIKTYDDTEAYYGNNSYSVSKFKFTFQEWTEFLRVIIDVRIDEAGLSLNYIGKADNPFHKTE